MLNTKRNEVEISPFLQNQSILLDYKTGTRMSVSGDFTRSNEDMKNYFDLFVNSESKFGNKPCFGIRKSFDDSIKWKTYTESLKDIRAIGSALHKRIPLDESKMVGIYSRNCPEWVCTHFACAAYGLVSVPVYDTIGQEAIEHILRETNMAVAVCYTAKQGRHLFSLNGSQIKLVVVINTDADDEQTDGDDKKKFISFEELLKEGKNDMLPLPKTRSTDLREILYTSGSTGLPKGVIYSHETAIKSGLMAVECLSTYLNKQETVAHLSYLPLAHVFEQMMMFLAIYYGAQIGFITTDVSGLTKDMMTYRPTFMVAVPRVLTRIYTLATKMLRSKTISRLWLESTIQSRMEEQKRGVFTTGGILDWLCFSKIRAMLGGRVKFIVCGSAALSVDVIRFIRVALACPMCEGYASTESGSVITLTLPGENKHGYVGAPTPGTKIKLVDVPSMDIRVERDKMGEILTKTIAQTEGYFKNEKLSEELYDADGFLRTGDIGTWTEEGALKIVDRCKNAFKLAQGEFVSPEKVEAVYYSSDLVTNLIVVGSSEHSFPVAIVDPDMTELHKRLAATPITASSTSMTLDLQNCSNADICNSTAAKNIILEDFKRLPSSNKLFGFEIVKAVYLTSEPFSIQNELLTPTMKVNRPKIKKRFAEEVQKAYSTAEVNDET